MRVVLYGEPTHGRTADPSLVFALLNLYGHTVRVIDSPFSDERIYRVHLS